MFNITSKTIRFAMLFMLLGVTIAHANPAESTTEHADNPEIIDPLIDPVEDDAEYYEDDEHVDESTIDPEDDVQSAEISFNDITTHELAALAVIDEQCQHLITVDTYYHQGFARLMSEFLPQESNPVAELKILTQSRAFIPLMEEARQDAQRAGDEKNREICLDIQRYAVH